MNERLSFLFVFSTLLCTAGATLSRTLLTTSSQPLRPQINDKNIEDAIEWAVGPGQRPLDSRAKRQSPNDVTKITVSQSGLCRKISWPRASSSFLISFYRIYVSTNDESFTLIATVSASQTTWEHCCKAKGVSTLKYGVSIVQKSDREEPVKTSETIVVASSFGPVGELLTFAVPTQPGCCVKNHAIAYNSIDDNFLVVFDCGEGAASTELYYVLVNGSGKPEAEIQKATVTVPEGKATQQGNPSVAFNPITNQYAMLFQLRDQSLRDGKYLIVSWLLNGTTGELSGPPSQVAHCSNSKKNKPEDCRYPRIVYNPDSYGYVMTIEHIDTGVTKTIGVALSSEAKFKKIVQNFQGSVDYFKPEVIYEPAQESILFAAQIDKKFCDSKAHCKGYAIIMQRYSRSKSFSKCIIGTTWAKSAGISLLYDEARNETIACYKKETRRGTTRIVCHRVGYDRSDGCSSLPVSPFCSASAQNGQVIYFPPGNSLFSVGTESGRIGGNVLEKNYLGSDVTAPAALYRRKSGHVCVVHRPTDTCGSVRVRCFEPSSKCNADCCDQSLNDCSARMCGSVTCSADAFCTDKQTCQCNDGYRGNGIHCASSPCLQAGTLCSENAQCIREESDNYICRCSEGFIGNGTHCTDVRHCSKDAELKDNTCICKVGYVGNGIFCCKQKLQDVWNVEYGNVATLSCLHLCMNTYLKYEGYLNFSWNFHGESLDETDPNYRLSKNGAVLAVQKLSRKYIGPYTCNVRVRYETSVTKFLARIDIPPKNTGKCQCGQQAFLPRVSSANKAARGESPWQAMLCHHPDGVFCGGVMISPCCVLTAAHCLKKIKNKKNNEVTVCLGKRCGNCNKDDEHAQCFSTSNYVEHPDYDKITFANDVALIKLDRGECLQCGDYIRPICLPQATRDKKAMAIGKDAKVTGWGANSQGGGTSNCLGKGTIQFKPLAECKKVFKWKESYNKLCATDDTGACGGDSGGPLAVRSSKLDRRWVLAGLVGYGYECGSKTYPGVYLHVEKYLDWIYENCDSL